MQGYQMTFYTQQDRIHRGMPLAQWLLGEAQKQGLKGGTVTGALQGFGHDGQTRTVNMFDLSNMPVQVTLVVTEAEAEKMLACLEQEQLHLFYVKLPVEFGVIGRS